MLKSGDNPPITPPRVESLIDLPGPWWVGHTRARFEKTFAWDLDRRGIGYFLPMVERVRVSGGRKRRVMQPLFPGYVFFCGESAARYDAMCTGRLCQTIAVVDQDALRNELRALEIALVGGAQLDRYTGPAIGDRCRVTAGPFEGVEGTVVEHRGHARLVLQVQMLCQAAVLEIESDLLEPVA